jgi:hypothetical protein
VEVLEGFLILILVLSNLLCRVYLVNFSDANYIKSLKIMGKEYFNENEWKTAKELKKMKSNNLIDYDEVVEVRVKDQDYMLFLMEYANAGVFSLFLFIMHVTFIILEFIIIS